MRNRATCCTLLAAFPIALAAFSTGPPVKRTGAPADGGLNCAACHRTFAPANSDARGGVRIDVANYVPGVKQTIHVAVSHPDAVRWGFQITARLASDETKTAGELLPGGVVKVMCDDGSTRGSAAPCQPSQLQFAEHNNAPRTDAGAGFTFSVDWTPPATDLGDVVFYAAGNAANGDGGFTGDRIYTTVRRISPPCTLTAKPSARAIANAASFGPVWSPGSMLAVFGVNFAPTGKTRKVTAGDVVAGRFPESLACITVAINGQNASVTYVDASQANVQVPHLTSSGSATLVVIANPGAPNELRSDPLTVTGYQPNAPAFFTFNGKSAAATSADGESFIVASPVVAGGVSAKPGDIVVMYGTGFGAMNPDVPPGATTPGVARATSPLTVKIGGATVPTGDILYTGLSPNNISGLNQVNVRLPVLLGDGDVPVTINVGGVESPQVTIPVKR